MTASASASASAAGARPPHPLQPLNDKEIARARDVLVKTHGAAEKLFFRSATLEEPRREDLVKYLAVEHGHEPGDLPVLARLARIEYDVIKAPGEHDLTDAVVDVGAGTIVAQRTLPRESQPSYTGDEFGAFQDACVASDMFKEAIKEFEIPENFTIAIDPWPYGPLEADEGEMGRTMQGLVFCRDASKNNLDSNHYAYPLPIIPIMDFRSKKVVRIDRLATGGRDDPLEAAARGAAPRNMFARAKAAEYVPELLERPLRTDLKPINITQPEGASFRVTDGSLVEWQKWRFRLGFTHREGAVLHDVCYDNRPLFLRVSFSEMTVPYADPRPPFHRKQAFDFGDGGAGHNANNLGLGCDCLGAIYYFDAWDTDSAGAPARAPNVVCLHEQDNGVGWKHTNFRTGRAVVTRLRELVVQFVITLANYEYIFAYKLDTAGGLTLETRATGIVSVVAIDAGKTSAYGNVVAPGVLAQNHQHIFAARLDPAVDSYAADGTRVVLEESRPVPLDPATNPHGNLYAVARDVVGAPRFADAEPRRNRLVRLESRTRTNPVSGKATGYKFTPSATQLLLADPASVQAARAPFAAHHVWVTGHRDNEFWAAGEWTNQSRADAGGVQDMVRRGDWFSDGEAPPDAGEGRLSTPVVWSVFGLTHNPRVEDWPVMPVEIHQVHIKPSDFFDSNPALDVPSLKNEASVLLSSPSSSCCNGNGNKAEAAAAHGQGTGPDLDPKEVVAR